MAESSCDHHENTLLFERCCPLCKESWAEIFDDLTRQVEELRNERCYICRPDDPRASKEGCPDCDHKSDLNQEIEKLKIANDALET